MTAVKCGHEHQENKSSPLVPPQLCDWLSVAGGGEASCRLRREWRKATNNW